MTQEHKLISLDYIINKIKRHPLMVDLDPEIIIEQALTVVKLAGLDGLTVLDSCVKQLKTRAVKVPSDSEGIVEVYYSKEPVNTEDVSLNNKYIRMKNDTDNLGGLPNLNNASTNRVPSFKINGNVLVTNRETGYLLIVYNKYMVDGNGIPLVPDLESLLLAIENYIKKEYFSILLDIGKISNGASLNKAETDYTWYIGQTQSYLAGFKTNAEVESFLSYFRKLYKEDSTFYERDQYNNNVQLGKPL